MCYGDGLQQSRGVSRRGEGRGGMSYGKLEEKTETREKRASLQVLRVFRRE